MTSFGQASNSSVNGFSPFRFEAAAIGETTMKVDNALPTVSFVTATGTTTATIILYSTGTGFKSSYSTATTVANQAGYYRGITAHSVAVLSDVYIASTSNSIAKN